MLGASFILLALSGSLRETLTRFSERDYMRMAFVGILIYAGLGLLPMCIGRNFLDYGVLSGLFMTKGEEMARSHSMLGVEIGVAITVMSIMFAMFANLSTSGSLQEGL